MNDNQDPQDERDPDMPQQSQHPRHKSRGHKHSVNPLAHSHSKSTGKKFKAKAKVANKGIKHAVVSFAVANAGWIAMILGVLFVILIVIMMAFTLTDDDDDCQSGGGGGDYTANFRIVGIVNDRVSTAIEKWCASKQLSASQTAAVLGSCMQESTMGTVNDNYLGWSNPSGTNADMSHNTSNVASYFDAFIKAEGGGQPDQWWSHPVTKAPIPFEYFQKNYKNRSPSDCEEFWGHHMEVCGQMGSRVQFAQEYYKKIAGGSSNVTSADNTADAGDASASSCGQSDSGDTNDIIGYAKRYLGLPYTEGPRAQGAEGIASGKPKSDDPETDCSGFVWGVLKHCGYGVSSTPWTVGNGCSENTYFQEHHETVSKDQTHAGTVVMANENAHTAILLEKWHGPSTRIIQEGGWIHGKDSSHGGSAGDCNDDQTYGEAFGSGNGPDEFANPKKA